MFIYQTARERLERKYGGKSGKFIIYLDVLYNFKSIRKNHPKLVEKLNIAG